MEWNNFGLLISWFLYQNLLHQSESNFEPTNWLKIPYYKNPMTDPTLMHDANVVFKSWVNHS